MTSDIGAAARGDGLHTVFQPIVQLPGNQVVGYEALSRWSALPDVSPTAVFAHAGEIGQLDALDALCIERAASAALNGDGAPGMLLAINSEPAVVNGFDVGASLSRAAAVFTVVFELTERGLLTHPEGTLRKVAALRADGFAIALDDVGAHEDSLALLDVIAPEVVKLDFSLVQRQPDDVQARTLAAVVAHQERTGSTIIAEGIETDEHLERALAYGAALGQGFRFGIPSALDVAPVPWSGNPAHGTVQAPIAPSIFDLVTAGLPKRMVRKATLQAFTRQLERLAAAADSPPIILVTLQHVRNYSGATRTAYLKFAETSPLVAVFGEGLSDESDSRVRAVDLGAEDPLCREWALVILGRDTCATLLAREVDGAESRTTIPERDRRFDMALTFERSRVTLAARGLLARVP